MGNAHSIGLRVIWCQLYLCLATYECRSGDLICWDKWNFDLANQAQFDRTIVNQCQKLYVVTAVLLRLWIDRNEVVLNYSHADFLQKMICKREITPNAPNSFTRSR